MLYCIFVYYGPFYVSLVFVAICSVFWLFWLSYQYMPSDWLERLLWGSLIVVKGSSPESPGRRVHVICLVYCIASLFYYVFVLFSAPTWCNYFPTFMARYSLFVLRVPLNPKQTNKQTKFKINQPVYKKKFPVAHIKVCFCTKWFQSVEFCVSTCYVHVLNCAS